MGQQTTSLYKIMHQKKNSSQVSIQQNSWQFPKVFELWGLSQHHPEEEGQHSEAAGGPCSQCTFSSWNGTQALQVAPGRPEQPPHSVVRDLKFHEGQWLGGGPMGTWQSQEALLQWHMVFGRCPLSIPHVLTGVCCVPAPVPGMRTTEGNTCSVLWKCSESQPVTPKRGTALVWTRWMPHLLEVFPNRNQC